MTTEEIIEHHTLHGEFALSGGGTSDTYIDLRAALLCWRCGPLLLDFYYRELEARNPVVPVVTGTFGAILAGMLARTGWGCLLWNPKGHGIEWSGLRDQKFRTVVLLDDVVTTGGTLRALRAACEAQGWEVVGEIVAVRR